MLWDSKHKYEHARADRCFIEVCHLGLSCRDSVELHRLAVRIERGKVKHPALLGVTRRICSNRLKMIARVFQVLQCRAVLEEAIFVELVRLEGYLKMMSPRYAAHWRISTDAVNFEEFVREGMTTLGTLIAGWKRVLDDVRVGVWDEWAIEYEAFQKLEGVSILEKLEKSTGKTVCSCWADNRSMSVLRSALKGIRYRANNRNAYPWSTMR